MERVNSELLDVQILYFKWRTFLLIHLKCWVHQQDAPSNTLCLVSLRWH